MRRLTPINIALIAAGILILALVLWTVASTRRGNPDRLTESSAIVRPGQAPAADSSKRCGAQATYDLIKRDLFRRAAALRGSEQSDFDKVSTYAVVRIDRPLLDSEDEGTGAISCSGTLTLDLPPGLAVVGGRRSLSGDIGYALQRSADGNGQVLTLTRADAIITPLATLARVGQGSTDAQAPVDTQSPTGDDGYVPIPSASPPAASPDVRQPAPPPPVVRREVRPPPAPAPIRPEVRRPPAPPIRPEVRAPAAPPRTSARPSFNCRSARTHGEIAVCRNGGLASLDRQMAAQYVNAMRDADPGTRAQLRRSRDRFLGYRDRCPSDDCIADTYRGRMREIRDISNGQ
jgi:uncharacterized protein YecT (DUF1311 family)